MTAIDDTPVNKNFLSPLNFQFSIQRAPYTNFFIQKINIPSITLPSIDIPNVFVPIPNPDTHIQYGDLEVTFNVDEDLTNYMEIHNWIRALGFPDNYTEHQAVSNAAPTSGNGITSDISVIILDAVKRPNYEITFRSAFPINLTGIAFDTSEQDVNYISATATFDYLMYDIAKIIN